MASKASKRNTKKKNNYLWLLWVGIAAIVAVPIVVTQLRERNLPGEKFASQGNLHIQIGADHPPYNSNPPTSGPHAPTVADWRSYDYIVPDELLIHNMEDGGVILWYTFGTPEENDAQIQALEDVSQGYRRVVIAPREDMPTPFALTAWTRLQRFEDIDREGMRAFIEAFEGIDHHQAGGS